MLFRLLKADSDIEMIVLLISCIFTAFLLLLFFFPCL